MENVRAIISDFFFSQYRDTFISECIDDFMMCYMSDFS
jgi:hypothetical protein